MHNPESVLEDKTYKLLWDFELQTDHLIAARQPDLVIINNKKEKLTNYGLCCLSGPQRKIKESEKGGKYLDLERGLKNLSMKLTVIPLAVLALGTIPKRFIMGLEDLDIRGQIGIIQTAAL